MTIFVSHRINSIKNLHNIHSDFGVEIDLRDYNNDIILAHDPFLKGDLFEDFLKAFKHSFLILNIKSEGIEFKILELLKKYHISNYFFLDCSFPVINKLINIKENKIAIRYSEYESLETILNFKNKVEWIWIDNFNFDKFNLDKDTFNILKKNGFKLCFVSPELQNRDEKLEEYRDYLQNNFIRPDMICTKSYNIPRWINSDLQIIIPMSGLGKRFVDEGYSQPKPLIEVDNKTIIEHVIDLFPGENNFQFICNDLHIKTTNMKEILLNKCKNANIHEVDVNERYGPVHAVSKIFDHIQDDKEVIVSYCDYGTKWDYFEFLKICRNLNVDGSVVCYKGFHPHMLGTDNYAFCKEKNGFLEEIQEKKPYTDNKINEYASNGTYYFKSGLILKKYFQKLIEKDIKVNNEYYTSMVYNLLLEDGLKVNIFEIENMLQWGTPYDLEIYKSWSSFFSKIMKHQKELINLKDITTILPMAGKGSRFSEKGYILPKPLLHVNNKPMIVEAVNCLPKSNNIIFICLKEHLDNSNIRNTLESYYPNCQIIEIDKVTEGQACTCEIGINKGHLDLEKPILISACDNGVYYNLEEYQKLINDETIDVIVWSFRNNQSSKVNPNAYAWLKVNENNEIEHVSCKKFIYDNPLKTHAIIGTMFFRKARYFIDGLKKNYKYNIRTNNEFYVDDVINQNIKAGLKVKVFESEHYICWGTPDDYETYLYWQKFFDKCYWHPYKQTI